MCAIQLEWNFLPGNSNTCPQRTVSNLPPLLPKTKLKWKPLCYNIGHCSYDYYGLSCRYFLTFIVIDQIISSSLFFMAYKHLHHLVLGYHYDLISFNFTPHSLCSRHFDFFFFFFNLSFQFTKHILNWGHLYLLFLPLKILFLRSSWSSVLPQIQMSTQMSPSQRVYACLLHRLFNFFIVPINTSHKKNLFFCNTISFIRTGFLNI